jgi:hypothetical protein
MGIEISVNGQLEREGILRRPPRRETVFEGIQSTILETIDDDLMRQFVRFGKSDNALLATLHPAAEPVAFQFQGRGMLTCSAETNTVGPGYHVFVLNLLESIGPKCGIHWQWGRDEEFSDPTGYRDHGNFLRVQNEMLDWLRGITKHLLNGQQEYELVGLCMPLDYIVIGEYFATSPLGFRSREWFESVANADFDELRELGKGFFPWWEEGMDAEFWLKAGRVLAWVELPWHQPANERETVQYQLTLSCFERAKSIAPQIGLPEREIGEIRTLLAGDEIDHDDVGESMGFRKRVMKRELTGGWTIDVPGYYYDDLERNGETVVCWFEDRTIRGSSLTLRGKGGKNISADELLARTLPSDEAIEHDDLHIKGRAEITLCQENDESYWRLQGWMAMTNAKCLVTICFDDAKDREWAVETWRSVSRPPPSESDMA